ncbi:YkgJ family cysteine cluster protein [Sediminibacterium soli]|uniref:YkgJ family cysteine cluster protein n=1 Tax=Sediminibacterium soli TaxID=2698829 RepID=UPI00137A3460|nr:YkgJ family cysteine cluster protein [Sediminibacterium soli]NCI46492.1 YkgJ family cysteine cluster protein [Sediminibacterium soli]
MPALYTNNQYLCPINQRETDIETDLDRILALADEKTLENQGFTAFLKAQDAAMVDAMVLELDTQISPKIDCTACGNCCKSLMIVVSDEEADRLSGQLNQSRHEFDACYLEKGSNGMMIMNRIPCHFLSANKCTVYEHRFAGCREFPALHIPGFTGRLFTVFMHYGRCPIIFNVVETLKKSMKFVK